MPNCLICLMEPVKPSSSRHQHQLTACTSTSSRHHHQLTAPAPTHGTTTSSRHHHQLTAPPPAHGTSTNSRHQHHLTATAPAHGTTSSSRHPILSTNDDPRNLQKAQVTPLVMSNVPTHSCHVIKYYRPQTGHYSDRSLGVGKSQYALTSEC